MIDTTAWEDEGARIAIALDNCGSAVIVGDDTGAAAHVALGIGRVHARRRRVAIADLVGEEPVLQSLVPADAPHGIVDSFLYGVSMNKIAHAIDPAQNLYILPSGSGPLDVDSLMRNERWRKLAAGFQEVDALLLLVASSKGSALDALIGATDGAIVVGGARVGAGRRIIASVPAGPSETEVTFARAPIGRSTSDRRGSTRDGGGKLEPEPPPRSRRVLWLVLLAALLLAAAALYWAWDNGLLGTVPSARPSGSASVANAGTVTSAQAMDLAGAAEKALLPFTDSLANPADSARAKGYVLVLSHLSDARGAALTLERDAREMAAATFSPVMIHDMPWYRVTAGAFSTRASADSMVRSSRQFETAAVLYAPYSVLLATGVEKDSITSRLRGFRDNGYPVFELVQDDGTVTVYTGAFETPEQSVQLLSELRADSVQASVAYRTGTLPD